MAAELRAQLGDRAAKVPRHTLPDLAVKAMGRVNPELRGIVAMLGRLLGRAPRPATGAVVAGAESLLDRGVT